MSSWDNNEEIQIFREYLRIPSVHPDIDYEPCIAFLIRQSQSLNLSYKIHHGGGDSKKPIMIITWLGEEPDIPTILLNSHMDVVPVFPEMWTHPPFAAEIDAEGRIYARGSQDMKCVGMQYLAAIRELKRSGVTLKRTVHITFVPDEEIGGFTGMGEFIKSSDFTELNVGFALDEGLATPDNKYVAFYAERTIWQINFKFSGPAGHGSLLLKNTAGSKLQYLLNKFMEMRERESQRLEHDPDLTIGDVTSINLTQIKGGLQANVVPPLLEACFDMRIAIDVDVVEFTQQLRDWCEEAGGGIELEWVQKFPCAPPTAVDETNPYWIALQSGISQFGITVDAHVFVGGTDSQFLRAAGIPAIGFSPMNNTPVLLHDHDEFLKAETYLHGIDVYIKIIAEIANVP